ncbi:NADP-dependent phosphogluconate dehydrogenase [Histomonas meleagridis]|uniref:NADP-dependent phosphogluconate dehydrogenase n=1 Tax=Histomonas meleagridis TaxID=135588 RepID=UPI003559570D|nr:NADP-dependent phosphogluconate dehydrogenase [Histomonas meleagridis]KAH0801520.1 NADP-dependent phosphogluconate dehydrogenase [Histomonas meleagridis]
MCADICVSGLGVMGSNIARNIARNGFNVIIHNRSYAKTQALLDLKEGNMIPCKTIEEIVLKLKRPRIVLIMITAEFVDQVLDEFLNVLEPGDIIIDGGNSYWKDTNRRLAKSEGTGIHFVGMGISGGEEGALNGPSMMFGGSKYAWDIVKDILIPISAKASDGSPCVDYIGTGSAGHFVKMVHNAIEYADMQLIAETYHILKNKYQLDNEKIADLFGKWNQGLLKSYLIEITEKVIRKKESDGKYLLDLIVDRANQKGTGKWAAQDSFDFGIPAPAFSEAVAARSISFMKEERVCASKVIKNQKINDISFELTFDEMEDALYASKIVCYAQGLALIKAASEKFGYGVNISACARIWRGGCIIRAAFLRVIAEHYTEDTKNLLMVPHFRNAVEERIASWRKIVALGALGGFPIPLFSSTLTYFDSYRSDLLPANLLQGLRDCFGAHTYERFDKPGNFHTEWEK